MTDLKKRLSREQLDELMLSAPEARISYETARLALQVGRELRRAREVAHLTEFEVAKRVGIEQEGLSRLESGEDIRDATLALLARVAYALHRRVSVRLVELDAPHAQEDNVQPRT